MPQYRFKAIDSTGKVVNGVSSAPTQDTLSGILQAQGLFLMESAEMQVSTVALDHALKTKAEAQAQARTRWRLPGGGGKVTARGLAFLTSQLYIMVRSSLPLLESLNLLAAQASEPKMKETMKAVAQSVSEGLSLSAAFAKHHDVFDDVYISLLAAGEMGGELDKMLERLTDYQTFRVKLAQNIRAAVAYPLVILTVSAMVVSFLLLFVLPTFMQIFIELNIPLPPVTRAVMFASELFRSYWWAIPVGGGAGYGLAKRWLRDPANARRAAKAQLAIPVVGELTQNIVMTRTLRTMGSLMASGVSILKCLELSKAAAGNPVYADLLDKVATDVREGKPVSDCFAESDLIPPVVSGMLSTGERTGQLPEVIARVAEFYERETEASIKNLFVVLEPIFILTLGLFVAGVAISVFLPMFSMMREIH